MKRPPILWLLVLLLVFLGFGGLYGGWSMLADPSGRSLGMDSVLPLLPVPDYVFPGLFLISIMGVVPFFLVFGLVARPAWTWTRRLAAWSRHHLAWTGTLVLAICLFLWLAIQAVLIGFRWPIQFVVLGNALLILATAMLPSLSRHFKEG